MPPYRDSSSRIPLDGWSKFIVDIFAGQSNITIFILGGAPQDEGNQGSGGLNKFSCSLTNEWIHDLWFGAKFITDIFC